MSPALRDILSWCTDNDTETRKPRINRTRIFLDALAEEGLQMNAADARSVINERVDSLAAHLRVTRPHLLRQYIDEEWVRTFARNIARAVLEDDD